MTVTEKMRKLTNLLKYRLICNKIELFRLQHRDGKKKRIFSPSGSFKIGVGSTQPGHLKLAIKELRILSSIHSRIPAYASAR